MFENDEEENALQPQDAVVPQTQEDPDADVKRKLAYVAQYGDREDERKMAQNASNWLASNSTSSFSGDGAEKFRAFADQMYRGTKERTNDWTKDERKQRYDERFALAKDLTDKLNFVIEKNGDKEQFAEETRQAQNALSFLTNHTSKFDNWSSDNVNGFANRVNEMYDAAEKRRGHLEVFTDALKRGYFSTATMVAQGGMMLKPGELTDDDLQTIRALQENQNRMETAEMPHRTNDLRDIHSAGDVVDFISEAVGDNAYRTGIAVAGSMLGAGVAGAAGLGAAGTTAASIAGASAAGMAMNTGEAVGDQLDDGMTDAKNFSRALALGQGLGYSVVDGAFGVEQLLGKVGTGILKSIGRGTAKTGATVLRDIAANASWKTAAKNVAKSAIGEGIQEPSQSTISDVRRQYQTGKMLRTGETWEDYFWGKASEGAGAAAAALVTGGLASGLSVAGARRRVETTRRFADKLMQNPVYNNLSREHQILVGRHLINDSLLATDRYSTVLSDEDRASLQAQNAAIESDLASDEADGAENARKVLASITSDYALEDKATIADEARKNGTLRQIDAASLRETEREVRFDGQGENERVFSYYDKNTNQHLYRVTDGKDEVWMVAPPEGMKPAIDGETTFATLGEALNAMAENDAYNRARAENSKSKREVIKKAVNNIYGGENINLVLADGIGGIANEALRQKFERGGSDAKAGYDADTNTLVVMTDNINSLGELYTTLAHESKHREIADYILGRGENLKEGKARLFGGKANAGAEQFAQRHGIGLEEANEEMAVENASVEDVVKALRDSDSNLMSAAVRKVFDFVRQKMGADMSLTSGVISDADVRRELSFLYASGYLGKTKTAPVKINLVGDDYENDVQQGLQARRINDSLVTNPAPVEETAEEAAPAPETAPETPVEPIVEEMPAPETPSAAKVPKAKSSPAKAKASTAPTTKTVADGIETNLAEVQAAINDLAANVANMNDSKRVKAYEDGMKNAQRRFEKMSDDELKATIADLKVRDKNTATDAAHALLGIAYDVQNERNSAKPSTTPENAPVSAMSENGEQSTASAQNAPEAASDANTEANKESTTKPENKETKDEAGNVPDEEQAQSEPPAQGGQEAAEEGSPAEVSERDERIVVGTDKTVAEARELLKEDVTAKIAEISEEQGVPLRVVGVDLHGSRVRGDSREDSDLDVVVEYDGDLSEDSLFDALNAEPMTFDDIRVDLNPIRADKTGTLAEYMERSDAYDEEKRKKNAQAHENTPTSASGATDAQSTAPAGESKEVAPEVATSEDAKSDTGEANAREEYEKITSHILPEEDCKYIAENATDDELWAIVDAYNKSNDSIQNDLHNAFQDRQAFEKAETDLLRSLKKREAERFSPEYAAWLSKYKLEDTPARRKEWEAKQKDAQKAKGVSADQNSTARRYSKEQITFSRPYIGKTGAQLVAYAWSNKGEEYVDKSGNDRVRRVSDWEGALKNPDTNRDIVHHFFVRDTSGDLHIVSADTAARMLGISQSAVRSNAHKFAEKTLEVARMQEWQEVYKKREPETRDWVRAHVTKEQRATLERLIKNGVVDNRRLQELEQGVSIDEDGDFRVFGFDDRFSRNRIVVYKILSNGEYKAISGRSIFGVREIPLKDLREMELDSIAPKAVKQETEKTAPEAQDGVAAKPEKPAKPVLRTKGAKPPKSLQERADKAKKVLKPEIAKMSTTDLQRLAKVWRKQGDEHALALADAADALVELRNWEAKNTLKGAAAKSKIAADEEQKRLDKFIENEAPHGILAFMQENGPIMAKPERKRVTDWRGNVSWRYKDQTAGDALDNFFDGIDAAARKMWSNRIFGKGATADGYATGGHGDTATDALREWFNDDNLTIDDALDMLVKEHEAFEKFKARGGKTFEEMHDEEMAAREVKIDGDSYDIVDLDNNEIEREVYDNAFAEVMQTPDAVEQFSRGELNKLREGDILRFDHAETSWTFRSFDDAKGELIVSPYVDEKDELFKVFFPTKEQQEAVLNDRTTFRITENGWEKLQEKENENGNQSETGKGTHETVDRDAQGERGGKGGEALVLESATPAELKSEERKRKQKAEIAKRQTAPLKGGVGRVGQSLLDLGGAEGEDLFNRTQRAQAPAQPAAPTRAEAVAAMKSLGMDSALDDAHLRAKMREWERHADDPRFAARLKAANTLLADRAAKGKAELTDEDKARKALGSIMFKRVSDPVLIDKLEHDPKGYTEAYASAQIIDGKIYSPMAAYINGKLTEPFEIGGWQVAEEHPELADKEGKFKLDKTGKSADSLRARYNPYWHSVSMSSPLNDQFTTAYRRPNLVMIKVQIPNSDLESGYRAENAYSHVGKMDWKSGNFTNALKRAGKPKREVFLSRYRKVVGVLPNEEAARLIAKQMEGVNLELPVNVVTPEVREILRTKYGVKIGKPTGNPKQQARAERDLREMGVSFKRGENAKRAQREYDEVVARYTNADGSKKRGWMLAPNGKPTNLTERQWVQVRTPSFKRWFGDWEALAELYAARDFALNGEPVAEVSGEDFQKDQTGANTLIDRVADYFAKIGGKAESPDLGTVELTREGAKSSVAHGIGSRKAAAFAAVKEVIEKGVVFDRNDNWKGRGYATAAIAAPIRMGGKDYVCELIVNRYKDRNAFYLHEVNLKEKLSDTIKTATGAVSIGESARPVMSIIAQRLAEVNPASVSKVVDENGEPKPVFHGTNADFTTFDIDGVGGGAAYFTSDKDYAKAHYGQDALECFLNVRKPLSQEEAYDKYGVDFSELNEQEIDKTRRAVDRIKADGYDGVSGVTFDNDSNEKDAIAVFSPNQIKSATDNTGAFDAGDDDIRFKRSGLYTGSAADYEKPSLHAVGTGEGSQVYGWGLYASNVRGVAEKYAKITASIKEGLPVPEHAQKNGKDIPRYNPGVATEDSLSAETIVGEAITSAHGDVAKAKEYVESYARYAKEQYDNHGSPANKQVLDNAQKAVAEIDAHGDEYHYVPQVGEEPSQGNIYEQTFFTNREPGDESHLLNWYEPVSKENFDRIFSQIDKEGLRKSLEEKTRFKIENSLKSGGTDGSAIYERLSGLLGSPKAASEFLARAGIDGVKYPVDSYGSKGLKDGDKVGWNYVSFRDDNISVDHKWVNGEMLFKRGANEDGSTLPFATEDDPDVAFGTKEGIFQKTGIEQEFERVGDVGVMKEGAQRARDVSDVNDIIDKVNRGDAPSSSDLATLIHAYADRLAALDKLRRTVTDGSCSEELKNLEKAVENIVDGLRRAGNRSGHALQMLKIGVSLTGMRDTYHYLASEVKAIKAQQGLNPELTDAERKMVEAQTAQLKEINDKLQAELAKRDERIEDLEVVNKQLMELRRSISRKINKAITEKYGIQHEDTVNSAFARIGKRFSRTPGAVMKRGESASVALDDELRAGFAEALYGVGMNEGNARRLIADNFGNEAASLFDEYLKELGATKETRVAKSEERRKAARPAPADATIVRQKSRLDILRVATVANLDALGAEATDDAKHRAMAKYLRDFMKYTAKANPSMSSEEVLAKMAEEAKALDPNGTYDAASMLSVATGKRGYDVETRTAVGKRVAELEKALALAKQGKFTEAAKLAGIAYENDAQVLERYEKELREQLAEKSDRLVELMENPPEDSAAKVEEIKSLQDEIKQTAEAIANLRKEGTLAEKRAKIVEALKQKLAEKEKELAKLEGKPVDSTDLKEEAQRLRKKLNTLTREHNFIKTLRDQIAEYERRIEENDFETPLTSPRQKPERSAEVQRLIAERDRMRKRFKNARHAHQYKQLGLPAQLLKDAWQILGESKALKGSLDLSSMFRQGGQLTFAHPILWARNFRKTIDALRSEENAQRLMAEIMSRPNAKYYEQAGIDFTDWGVGATNADDRFAKYDSDTEGRFLLSAFRKFSRAKLIRLGVGASERAFSMYLNLMRADVFDAMVNGSTYGGAANMTERQLKAVGNYLNIASQRASFDKGSATAKAVDFLNTILWSPRNVISRFQFLWETAKLANPWANPYGDKTMRGLFAKELGRYLLGMGAMVMFAKTLADLMRDDDEPEEDIELDPRSSQFMCVKFGESRVDFMSGLKQVLTFLSRGVTRQSKNSRGQLREINVSDLLGSFLQTKFSPAASFVRDFVTGETFNRQDIVWDSLWTNTKDEKSAYRHLVETIVPLTFTDVIEQVEYSGWKNAVVTSMATIFGAGVNTYDPKTYKQLKNDFAYYRNLYAEADADSREELLRKHPMLRNQAAIEAAIKRVKEVEKFARNIEKHGGDPSTLQNTIEERRQKVIDLIAGGTSNR